MNTAINFNLNSIKKLLEDVSDDTYVRPSSLLSNSSIGQHTRHILEFFFCFLNGLDNDTAVNYDARKRSMEIETDKNHSIKKIEELLEVFKTEIHSRKIIVNYNESNDEANTSSMDSTSQRELIYCLDHSIHHQAMIKVALKEFQLEQVIDKDFGLAYSTIRNRDQCVQ